MRQLKNILKSSTYMVLPAVAALLGGKAANAAVGTVAPSVHAGLDKVHAGLASVPMSGVASKHFAQMTGHSGNVVEALTAANSKLTTMTGKVAYAEFKLAQDGVFVGRNATHTIVSDVSGATFVAKINASYNEVAKILGTIHAPAINFAMVTPGSIHLADGSSVNVKSLTLAAGQQFDGFTPDNKFHMHTVNADAVITKSSAATINVADAGLVSFVSPNVAVYGFIAGVEAKDVKMVNADKTTVDFYGDKLISFEISKASADQARALAAEFGAGTGIMLFSTVDALNAVKALVKTDGITTAQASMKVGGDVVLGAGYALSFLSADVSATTAQFKGLGLTVSKDTKVAARNILIGSDWFGGVTLGDYAGQLAKKASGTSFEGDSAFITAEKGARLVAAERGVVFSTEHTSMFAPIQVTTSGGYAEISSLGAINSVEGSDLNIINKSDVVRAADGVHIVFDPKHVIISYRAEVAITEAHLLTDLNQLKTRLANHLGVVAGTVAASVPLLTQILGIKANAADADAVSLLAAVGAAGDANGGYVDLGNNNAAGVAVAALGGGNNTVLTVNNRHSQANAAVHFANRANQTTVIALGAAGLDTITDPTAVGVVATAIATPATGAVVHIQATKDIYVLGNVTAGNSGNNDVVFEAGRSIYVDGLITGAANYNVILHANSRRAGVDLGADEKAFIAFTPINAGNSGVTVAGTGKAILLMDQGTNVAAQSKTGDIILGQMNVANNASSRLYVSHFGKTGSVVAAIDSANNAAYGTIILANAGARYAITLGAQAAYPQATVGDGVTLGLDSPANAGGVEQTGWINAVGYQYAGTGNLSNYLFPGIENTTVNDGNIGKITVGTRTYALPVSIPANGSIGAAVSQGSGNIAINNYSGAAINASPFVSISTAPILGVRKGAYGINSVGANGNVFFQSNEAILWTEAVGVRAYTNLIEGAVPTLQVARDIEPNGGPASYSYGGLFTSHGNTIVRTTANGMTANAASMTGKIIGKNVALLSATVVGGAGLNLHISVQLLANGTLTGHAEAGIFKVSSGVALNVGSEAAVVAPLYSGNINSTYLNATLTGLVAGAVANHNTFGNLYSVTTTAGIAAFQTTAGGINFNKAHDGTANFASVISTDDDIVVESYGDLTQSAGAWLNSVVAHGFSLNSVAGNVGTSDHPITLRGAAGSYVNSLATAANKSIFLKITSNMVLGGAETSNANAAFLAVADNTGALVTGTGNIKIDAGLNVLTLAAAATALSAVDGTILVKAGDLTGVANGGFTGSKISMIVTQDKASRGTTGQIGRTSAILITGAVGYTDADHRVQLEAKTLHDSTEDDFNTAAGTANGRHISLAFANNQFFQIKDNGGLGKAVDNTLTSDYGLYAKDSLISLTLANTSDVLLGTVGRTTAETPIHSDHGGLLITMGGGASFLKVAHKDVVAQGVGLRLGGGNAAARIGSDGTLGAIADDLRFKFKAEGKSYGMDDQMVDDNFGVFSGAFTGRAFIQLIGKFGVGRLGVVAADAGTGVKGNKVNYGLRNSANTNLSLIHNDNLGVANFTLAADLSRLIVEATNGLYLSTSADVLHISGATAAAVIKAPSLDYFGPDGILAANRGNSTGRIRLTTLGQGSLLLNIDDIGGYKVSTTTGFEDNHRIKIGAGDAAANADASGYVFGSANKARFHVVNANGGASFLSFGNAKGGLTPLTTALFDNQLFDYAEWMKPEAQRTGVNTFTMNGDDSVFSLTSTTANDNGHVKFTGDVDKVSFSSAGVVAISAKNIIASGNTSFISVKNLMLKSAGTLGAVGADVFRVSQAAGGYIGVDATGLASINSVDTSPIHFGRTAEQTIDGLKVYGVKTAAGGTITSGIAAGSDFSIDGVIDNAAAALNFVVAGKANALLGEVSFKGADANAITFNLGNVGSEGNVTISNIKAFAMTHANGSVQFIANLNVGQKVTLTAVEGGAFADTSIGSVIFNGKVVDLGSHANFNKTKLSVTQANSDWTLAGDYTAGGFTWDLGTGKLLNLNDKTLKLSTGTAGVSLTAAALGDKDHPVLVAADFDAAAGAGPGNTHDIVLKSTGNTAGQTYGVFANLIGASNGRVIYSLGANGGAVRASDVSVLGTGDVAVNFATSDAVLGNVLGLINVAKGNLSLIGTPESTFTTGAAVTLVTAGKGFTTALSFKSLGAGQAAADFFNSENVVLTFFDAGSVADNETFIRTTARFFVNHAGIFHANVKNITLDGTGVRSFSIDTADLNLTADRTLTLKNVKSLTGGRGLTAKSVAMDVSDSVAWNFLGGTKVSGTADSLTTTLDTAVLNGLKVTGDANVTLAGISSLGADFTVGGKLTLTQATFALTGDFALIAGEIVLTTGDIAAQTLKTQTSKLTLTTGGGATGVTTIKNTSDDLELAAVTLGVAAGGLSLTQSGNLNHTGALVGNAAALTLNVGGVTKVTNGTLNDVALLTFTGKMDADSTFKFAGVGVAQLTLLGSVGRFALDNGGNAITINAFNGTSTSDVSVKTTAAAGVITLGGKLKGLGALTLEGHSVVDADAAHLEGLGSFRYITNDAIAMTNDGKFGFAAAAGVDLSTFGTKNLTLGSTGGFTVAALGDKQTAYDLLASKLESLRLVGSLAIAAAAPTAAAAGVTPSATIDFVFKGLTSFGVENTGVVDLTVDLNTLTGGLAKSSSTSKVTVSHATLINVAGFSGAGTLAFDGAAVKATASDVTAKISALDNVVDLTLTDSDVTTLSTLTGAAATLTTLAFNAKGTITTTHMATAGAGDITVTATSSKSDSDDSKVTGVLNQPTAQTVKVYANTHEVTGFTMKAGGSVTAALNSSNGLATSVKYRFVKNGVGSVVSYSKSDDMEIAEGSTTMPTLTLHGDGTLVSRKGFAIGEGTEIGTHSAVDDFVASLDSLNKSEKLTLKGVNDAGVDIEIEVVTASPKGQTVLANTALLEAIAKDLKAVTTGADGKERHMTQDDAVNAILAVETTTEAATADISANVATVSHDAFHVAAFNTDLVQKVDVVAFMNMVTRGGTFVPAATPVAPTATVAKAAKPAVTVDAAKKDEKKKAKPTTKNKVAAAPAPAKTPVVDAAAVAAPVAAAVKAN